MCDYMINSRMCKRAPLSGVGTIENEKGDMVAYLCRQHVGLKKNNMLDLTKVQWTNKVIPTNNKENKTMNTTKTISCGHCKGSHFTVQEVADCYGVVRTHNSTFQPTNRPMVKEFDNGNKGEWFATRKAVTQRCDDLKKEGKTFTRKSANNGNGYWVYTS